MTLKLDFDLDNIPSYALQPNKVEYLMLFLHGYGSDGNDLIQLANLYAQKFTNFQFIAPHAPGKLQFGGHYWFPLQSLSPQELEEGTLSIVTHLNEWIDYVLDCYGISPEKLILCGFSQGTMIALQAGIMRLIAPSAIIGFSGILTTAQRLDDFVTVKSPIFLCHGSNDLIVPSHHSETAFDALTRKGFQVEKHIFDGYEHTIPPQGLMKSIDFLKFHLKN